MVKINLCILFLYIFIGQLTAQQNVYEIDRNKEEDISSVIKLDNGNLIVTYNRGDSIDNNHPLYTEVYCSLLDSNFQLIKEVRLNNQFVFDIKVTNGRVFTYGSFDNPNNLYSGLSILKFDQHLNLLDSFTVEYDSSNIRGCTNFAIHPVSNNLHIPYSFLDSTLKIPVSVILELDTNLIVQKSVIYDTTTFFSNSCSFDLNNNLRVLNFSENYRQLPYKLRDVIFTLDSKLLPIDKMYAISNQFNVQYDDTLKIEDNTSLFALHNGNFLVSGSIYNPINFQANILDYFKDYGFALFNSSDSLIQFNIIGELDRPDEVAFNNTAADSSYFYIVASNRWITGEYYRKFANAIVVNKFDLQGNVIYQKSYTFNGYSRIQSISITQNDGLIMAGSIYKPSAQAGSGINGLIVELDSNGTITSLNENIFEEKLNNILVFPNPTTNLINFISKKNERLLKLEVFDMNGKLCYSEELASNKLQLEIESWNKSIYFYNVINENGVRYSGKFIKL